MTCTLSPRTIFQLLADRNIGFIALSGLLGIVAN
jgi:hypothetical protein